MAVLTEIFTQTPGAAAEAGAVPDSLASAILPDSLASAILPDSISSAILPDSAAVVSDTIYQPLVPVVDPAVELFGPQSIRIEGLTGNFSAVGTFADNLFFQILLLGLLFFYLYTVFAGRSEAGLLLRLATGTNRERRPAEEYRNILSSFTGRMLAVGFAGAGIAVARTADVRMSVGDMSPGGAWAWSPVLIALSTCAVILAINLMQYLFLKGAGNLTFSTKIVDKLLWSKTIAISAGAIMMSPLVLLAALAPPLWAQIFLYAYFFIGAAFVLGFSHSSYKLFVKQKVSILFWILYLCAVELMPFAIVVIAVLRNTGF